MIFKTRGTKGCDNVQLYSLILRLYVTTTENFDIIQILPRFTSLLDEYCPIRFHYLQCLSKISFHRQGHYPLQEKISYGCTGIMFPF